MTEQQKHANEKRQPLKRGDDYKSVKPDQKAAEEEAVDEAAMESFPASDPPSWSASTTSDPTYNDKGKDKKH